MASNSSENAYSVAAISQILKSKFEDLPEVWIEGELSQVNYRPGAGIMYMRLKDSVEDMSVSIHCYRNLFQTFVGLEENSKVKVKVQLKYWAKKGSLSFLVSEIEKVGVGDLLAKLEALKEKLLTSRNTSLLFNSPFLELTNPFLCACIIFSLQFTHSKFSIVLSCFIPFL